MTESAAFWHFHVEKKPIRLMLGNFIAISDGENYLQDFDICSTCTGIVLYFLIVLDTTESLYMCPKCPAKNMAN